MTIYYNQGTKRYDVEQILQPDEQMWIDVGKLIRQQIPDKNGKALPFGLTSGSYEIRDLTNTGVGTLFEGKIIYDKTYGHVAYGCGSCCGYKTPRVWYNPLGIDFLGTAADGLNALNTCAGQWYDVSGDAEGNWSSADTSIATVDYYGTHTGKSVGSTISSTYALLDAASFKTICPTNNMGGSGGANVTPTITFSGPGYVPLRTGSSQGPNSATYTATGTPAGGTFSWSASNTNVTLANANTATLTITAATASTKVDDTAITVKYTINNESAAASADITVVQPTSLANPATTDTTNPTGHTCSASAVSNTCAQSKFAGSGSYSSYVRNRTYHILDQFNNWISGYPLAIQESYGAFGGQCASDEAVTGAPSNGDTVTDCFYFCSATCHNGGSCGVSATQTITVNGYSVRTEGVTWTCASVTLNP